MPIMDGISVLFYVNYENAIAGIHYHDPCVIISRNGRKFPYSKIKAVRTAYANWDNSGT